jgi:hypothetical protein
MPCTTPTSSKITPKSVKKKGKFGQKLIYALKIVKLSETILKALTPLDIFFANIFRTEFHENRTNDLALDTKPRKGGRAGSAHTALFFKFLNP